MKYFTQEQIDKIKFMEPHFNTVIKAQYKIATPTKDNEYVASIYEEATSEKLYKNWGCNKCVFDIFKKIGNLYFESINYLEKQKEISNENDKYTESSNSTLEKRRNNIAKAREAKNSKKHIDKNN